MATASSAITQAGTTTDIDISSVNAVLYSLTENLNPNSFAVVFLSHFSRASGSSGAATAIDLQHFDEQNSVWFSSIDALPIFTTSFGGIAVTAASKPSVAYTSSLVGPTPVYRSYYRHLRSGRVWNGVVNHNDFIQPQASPTESIISTGDMTDNNTRVLPFILYPNERLVSLTANSGVFLSVHALEFKPGN